jgi:lipopolysaccharide transport system permease protein
LRNIQSNSMISPISRQDNAVSTTIIRSAPSSWTLGWADLARHRELLYFLAWRDIKIRYQQTALGVAWAILQPLAVALALAAFLGRYVHIPSDDLPYPVFAYAGMVLWQLFAQGLTESSNSVVRNEGLISKIYFPRLLVPLSAVLASLLDFSISLLVLILFLVYFRIAPTAVEVLVPFFVLPVILSSLGLGLWLSALNVRFRDVRYIVNFLVQIWFFATPVAYPTSTVPMRWRTLYDLNPMVGALDGFRWALRGEGAFPTQSVLLAVLVGTALLLTGLYYFRRTEDTFADFI